MGNEINIAALRNFNYNSDSNRGSNYRYFYNICVNFSIWHKSEPALTTPSGASQWPGGCLWCTSLGTAGVVVHVGQQQMVELLRATFLLQLLEPLLHLRVVL